MDENRWRIYDMKTMRTNMQEPQKVDPKAFHPNTASNGSLREHVGEQASTKAVRRFIKGGEREMTAYRGIITSKLKAPRKIM
jgi:hypothetical protein